MRSPNLLILKQARFKSSVQPVFCSQTFINLGIHLWQQDENLDFYEAAKGCISSVL